MDHVKLMGTTKRHMKILSYLDKLFIDRSLNEELDYGREQVGLVFNDGKLIDLSRLTKEGKKLVVQHMNQLKFIYPDFMVFKDNEKLENKNGTRFAGVPDLIIEVWSPFNSEDEKNEKRDLFRTDKSEFWEIEQDSMRITCWSTSGDKYFQFLDKPVLTPWGESLNLYPLSNEVRDVEPNDKYHGGADEGITLELDFTE